jgi:transcriptional regulator with XRE-family HTH domain
MTTANIESLETDAAILSESGARLARLRIDRGLTQAQLADQSGVGKRTVERLESGSSIQTASLLRIVRGLGLQQDFLALFPEKGPRPMDLLKLKGKERRRASTKRTSPKSGPEEWKWGDDS